MSREIDFNNEIPEAANPERQGFNFAKWLESFQDPKGQKDVPIFEAELVDSNAVTASPGRESSAPYLIREEVFDLDAWLDRVPPPAPGRLPPVIASSKDAFTFRRDLVKGDSELRDVSASPATQAIDRWLKGKKLARE